MFRISGRAYILIALFILTSIPTFAQSTFSVYVKGIKEADSVMVILQQGALSKQQKWAKFVENQSTKVDFELAHGRYSLLIDAKGYTFPSSTYITVPDQRSAEVTLTPLLNSEFIYQWKDDDSFAGHATQSYQNEPSTLRVLDSTVNIPSDYSSVKLRNEFGIVLSNDQEYWSSEDSYRLYSIIKTIPFIPYGEGTLVDFATGKNVQAIFYLTKSEQLKDIRVELVNGIKKVTISQSAFTYASAQTGNLDGVKVKFYSKRLHHAILNYFTDFGANAEQVARIARERYGIRFMKPDLETQQLMNEDASNFQEFFNEEKINILSMFEELPEGFHKQEGLKYLVRRINGQDHPIYREAPAIAWTSNFTIEFMSKAFNQAEIGSVQRLILHEKAHFLWAYSFDKKLKEDWSNLGGWFKDPSSVSGWSTYNTTEFVSAYAHQKNPDEDMAETIAAYVTNPDILLSRSVRKYEFIRDRVMHGTRYKAQIREDLTFMVYNLFPDYIYPGKITGVKISVKGNANEDKEVTIEFKLNSKQPDLDGASVGYVRLASNIGTIHDFWLTPKNGTVDSILIGKSIFSKHEKNGYWNIVSLRVEDPLGNSRYENTSTIGFKLYIENPLEDIAPPKWNSDLKMELTKAKFSDAQNYIDNLNGIEMKAVKYSYSLYDNSPLVRAITRIFYPKLDKPNVQIYEEQIQGPPLIDSARNIFNSYNSNKRFEMFFAVPEYYPSGYYSVSMLNVQDVANNYTAINFMKDTANYTIPDYLRNNGLYKDIRDSIYVTTQYPDYIAPEIDVNRIRVVATPTNSTFPDGETRVDISLLARDLSDYAGHEAGVKLISYNLRDPLGREYSYSSWNDNGLFNYYSIKADGNSEWKPVKLDILLPKGSAPGKWGIVSIQTLDRAGNFRNYSFVEIVRFDIIPSEVVLQKPLKASILNKFVNKGSIDSISASVSCSPCQNKKYVYQIYSLMGGNVVRGEGVLSSDSTVINNINLSGVLDGVIYLTIQVLDNNDQLIATTTSTYTKDTILPKAFYLRTNLQDQGYSNLDSLVFKVAVQSTEINGTYSVLFSNYSIPSSNYSARSVNSLNNIDVNRLLIKGAITDSLITLNNLKLNDLTDGIITAQLSVADSSQNPGSNETYYFHKENGQIKYIGKELVDVDQDGVMDFEDDCLLGVNAQSFVSTSGATTFCQGGKVTLTATEASSYLWSNGATTRSIEVSTGGNYSVTVTNANGCSATSIATSVTVNSLTTATITAGGPTTITQTGNVVLNANTGTGFTYQWLRDGVAINAATARTYTATSGGSYTVKVINATGCETLSSAMVVKTVFVLPTNNYQLNVQGETCRTSDNGRVNITAVQNLSYTATISRAGQTVRSINFSSNGELTGLSAGSYTLCITVAGQSEYKQCYDFTITEPQDLSVYSEVNLVTNTVELSMSGSDSYTINLNGKNYTSNSPRMSLALSAGLNKITVQAAQACQGVYTEEIYVDERVELYPNPFTGTLNIKIENQENKELNIKVLNGSGTIVYQAKQRVNNHLISLDLSQLESGYYFVVIGKQTYKVIKK
jgi:hypothetical protein